MCQISRAIIFRFNSKTQWQMFLLLYGISMQSSINLGNTLLQIMCEWKTAETYSWRAWLYINHLSYPRFLISFIEWIWFLVLITWLVETENNSLCQIPVLCSTFTMSSFPLEIENIQAMKISGFLPLVEFYQDRSNERKGIFYPTHPVLLQPPTNIKVIDACLNVYTTSWPLISADIVPGRDQ